MERNERVVNVSSGIGQLSEMNGCCPGYRLSKTALNAVTRILADELLGTGVKVNAVCPGWVRTDIGGPDATLSVEEGAPAIVWAATLPDDGASGGFLRHGEPIAWLPDWGIRHPIFRIPLADQDVFFVPSPRHSCLGPIPGE
jgi:NAD(P)-dependent dehydrogenase (short-subunit alcohol dehydrogenase family)